MPLVAVQLGLIEVAIFRWRGPPMPRSERSAYRNPQHPRRRYAGPLALHRTAVCLVWSTFVEAVRASHIHSRIVTIEL
jgi:hypothetical protein